MKWILFILLPSIGFAGSFMPSQSEYYYELGGSSDLFVPPIKKDVTIKVGGDVDGGLGFSCTGFNPAVSITNTFLDMKKSALNIPEGLIQSLTGGVAGFPLYKLQQAMPGLYNILQNTGASAQNDFNLRVHDCQAVKSSLEHGQSPIDSLLAVSDSQGWLDAAKRAKTENVDVLDAAKDISKKREEYGLPWLGNAHANSGGKYQRPIKVINDVVIAGYNILLERKPLDNTSAPTVKTPMTITWKTPLEASEWAIKILGDIHVSNKAGEKGQTKAGIGLSTLLQSCESSNTCTQNIAIALWHLVDGKWPLTEEKLRLISASNLLVTDQVILTIRGMPKEEQMLTVSKLAEEIAIQNMLDKALMMRRILQAGSQVQEVQNLKPALNMVNTALKRLDDDIHSLAFESEVRKKMINDTLTLVMDIRNRELGNSLPGDDQDGPKVQHGAVYKKETK